MEKDLDCTDDVALFADTIQEAELLLHKVESASKSIRLFLNPSKSKYMHINPSAKYLGSCTNSQHDIQCKIVQAWVAVFKSLTKFGECPSTDSPN